MVEIWPEPFDAGDGIADGLRQRGLAGDPGELGAESVFEVIKDRLGLPQSHPFIRWRSTRLCMANSYLLLRCDWSKPRLPQISWVLRFPSLSSLSALGRC